MRGQRTQPELPTLDPGLTLLEVDDRSTGALHSLVLDHVLLESGDAVWVDAHGHGTTQPLARIAPSLRLLKRIAIARAFTPWQHYSLLQALADECTTETNLLVLPAVDYFYRSEDCSDREGERLFTAGCSLITDLATTADVPIVLTRTADDAFTAPLMERVNTVIQCELTTFGPRFAGEDFETLVYPLADGTFQTTLAYWQRVLSARHPTLTSATSEVSTHGAN
ncbi:hypothetical protein [Halocatena marina]|uniref:DNA recombination and repair protein Rad51-like C-terminal domain-containing protein n=1 Tax=Halocatena marina TaxID=2934937 RepID=A0ABD5YUF1_9EURY|nr:hypothetical protein [Halocatena marina]